MRGSWKHKDVLRDEIKKQTDEYLEKGGSIKQLKTGLCNPLFHSSISEHETEKMQQYNAKRTKVKTEAICKAKQMYAEGWSYKEIADKLGVTEGTVKHSYLVK